MTQMHKITLPTEAATATLGARLIPRLRPGDVVLLSGGLGAGKTTLARAGIQAAIAAPVEVPSPTFTLVQTYDLPAGPLWHVDLYRLAEPEEVLELGWDDAICDAIVLVEWPERLGPLTPTRHIAINLTIGHSSTGEARQARITWAGDWSGHALTPTTLG